MVMHVNQYNIEHNEIFTVASYIVKFMHVVDHKIKLIIIINDADSIIAYNAYIKSSDTPVLAHFCDRKGPNT